MTETAGQPEEIDLFEFVTDVPTLRLVEAFKQYFTFSHNSVFQATKHSMIWIDDAQIGNHSFRIVQRVSVYQLKSTGNIEAVGYNQSIVRGEVEAEGYAVANMVFAIIFAAIGILFAFINGNFYLFVGILMPILTAITVRRDKYFRRKNLIRSIEELIRKTENTN